MLDSIAFYPTFIAIVLFLVALFSLWLGQQGLTSWLIENTPQLVVNNADTSRVLLSVFVGGVLSLTVFSFSMVMIMLTQAMTNFTPRLLPGIISSTRHQLVLGFYIGTILFCIVVLISIIPGEDSLDLPGFSIFLAILLFVGCLALFVYFIHSISQDIQPNTILNRLVQDTETRLQKLKNQRTPLSDFSEGELDKGQQIVSDRSAYFRGIRADTLLELAVDHDTVFKVVPLAGTYILEGLPLLVSREKLDQEAISNVLSCIRFGGKEAVRDNYVVGFKQITEIAVKAMSPGINDPGTALNAIDYLTHLFSLRMQLPSEETYYDGDKKIRIYVHTVDFSELLSDIMSQMRVYCKSDPIVVTHLMQMLNKLNLLPCDNESYRESIANERELMLADARASISNSEDLSSIEEENKTSDLNR